MGIFSRRKSAELPFAPFALKSSYDSFNHYVIEAKTLGLMYGIDFDKIVGNQKVFAFNDGDLGCHSFMVCFPEGLHILICKEEGPEFYRFDFEELNDLKFVTDYDGILSDFVNETEQDKNSVHFLRTPREVFRITAKETQITFIANSEQVDFVWGLISAKIERE
jgi:hypothetical protein